MSVGALPSNKTLNQVDTFAGAFVGGLFNNLMYCVWNMCQYHVSKYSLVVTPDRINWLLERNGYQGEDNG